MNKKYPVKEILNAVNLLLKEKEEILLLKNEEKVLKLENEIVTNEVTPEVSSTDEIKDLNEEYNEQVGKWRAEQKEREENMWESLQTALHRFLQLRYESMQFFFRQLILLKM